MPQKNEPKCVFCKQRVSLEPQTVVFSRDTWGGDRNVFTLDPYVPDKDSPACIKCVVKTIRKGVWWVE